MDDRVWLGDSRADLGGPASCMVDAATSLLECGGAESGSTFSASVSELASGELHLLVSECTGEPAECEAIYQRDADNPCDEAAAVRGGLGSRCESPDDCDAALSCQIFVERGVCTRSCTQTADCPDGSHCLTFDGVEASCVLECTEAQDCTFEGSECEWSQGLAVAGAPDYLCL